jgi:hypothetical protein
VDTIHFNFNDLIERFSSGGKKDTTKAPVRFSILNIEVNDGEFHYRELFTPVNYYIKKVNFKSGGLKWDSDTIAWSFSFLSGIGTGEMHGNAVINVKNNDFRLAVVATKFELKIIEQYLKVLTNYGSFRANLDADIYATGNLTNNENLSAMGLIAINDFHFGKNPQEDYASFDQLALNIIELSPNRKKYIFDSVSLRHPVLKYERYDHLDNIQNIFGESGSNVASARNTAQFNLIFEIADYVKALARNFFKSAYRINRVAIYKGDLTYNDFAISEQFTATLDPVNFFADSIDKRKDRVRVSFSSDIKPYGNFSLNLSINPKDSSDFDIVYNFQKLPTSMFNPYIVSYTSFPLDRGTIEMSGSWHVRNGNIRSENHLLVIDPRVTKRIRNKDLKWIPVPLIFYFVRERGNVIDYEIPITGDLNDPNFHFRDVILDILANIFVKPPTIPYRLKVKNIETEIEKSLTLTWKMRSSSLLPIQEKFIERMAGFLENTPGASISIYPQNYTAKEKEHILFFEAKKKYYLAVNHKEASSFNGEDEEKVDRMSVKDPAFVKYLDEKVNDPLVFTIQEKCARVIGKEVVNSMLNRLNNERRNTFLSYFKEQGVEKRIKIYQGKNIVPYNGFSFYKIEYKGELPDHLLKAYRKMNELNEKEPRKRFKKERKKDKTLPVI